MTNLLVEIGNTALKAAWTEGMTLGKTFRYQGEKTVDFISSLASRQFPEVMTVASVKTLSEKDVMQLSKLCKHLLVLDGSHSEVLDAYGIPDYLSYDRAASLIAVRYLFKGKACTVFDFGTTLTVDFMEADGTYVGGNISLGCRTRFKALGRYSKSLPVVDTPLETAEKGTSLRSSVESGVISGIMFEIEGYMRQKPESLVVFTGGDSNYFAKRMKNSIFVVCNLVLMGLALITDDYVKKNIQ